MAISRSLGATSFMTFPPIFSSPSEISSSPAIIRKVVDFPQPALSYFLYTFFRAISTIIRSTLSFLVLLTI